MVATDDIVYEEQLVLHLMKYTPQKEQVTLYLSIY